MSLSQVTGNIIGKRVKSARQKIELSQVELAATLCVDCGINLERVQISTIERGVRSVKDKELNALVLADGVEVVNKYFWHCAMHTLFA